MANQHTNHCVIAAINLFITESAGLEPTRAEARLVSTEVAYQLA